MEPFICVIPGDGCGKEVIHECTKILDILENRGSIDYEVYQAGAEYYEETGRSWDDGTFERARESDAVLFGAAGKPGVMKKDGTTPSGEVIFGLRNGLDLYANVRPLKLYPDIQHRISGEWRQVWEQDAVDLVIVRELTEGLYVRIGGAFREEEIAVDNRVITEMGSWRIMEFAANLAMDRRKHLTCVDKSNVLKGDRLFRRVFQDVVQLPGFSSLQHDGYFVDAFSMILMSSPEEFDVVVTPNLFGDILSDLGSVLTGGIGMAPSGSYGYNNAMFEPIHGSAPDIAGKGIVNPSASFLSLSMLLSYLSGREGGSAKAEFSVFSDALEKAVIETISSGTRTPDLGGDSTTSHFGDTVKERFMQYSKIGC